MSSLAKRFLSLTGVFSFGLVVAGQMIAAPSAMADRGGWVASGGELFRYGKNPWFLKNTKSVDYCIDLDTASVSASKTTVQEVIREAIAYWQNEFKAQGATAGAGFAALGTQVFNEVSSCSEAVPLQFRIGHGVLDKDELEEIQDPKRFVGVSIRKEYDTVTLAGKGIVFISSDRGPNAYTARPDSTHLFPEAWKERRLLFYALIHEMGHVFGIPHTGNGLMSEVFLEQLLHKRFVQFYLDNPVAPFLLAPLTMESCLPFSSFNAGFFQIPTDAVCLRLEGKSIGANYEWSVFYREKLGAPLNPAGTLKASPLMQLLASAKPVAIVQLPTEQKVFSLTERQMNTFMIGPVFVETTARGLYTTTTSPRPFDLQLELRPESVVMTGLVGGRMMPVFIYSPPSLITQFFPTGP